MFDRTGLSVGVFAQNVVVQTTNNESSKRSDECSYRINGVCATEDIGGVEVNFYRENYYAETKYMS